MLDLIIVGGGPAGVSASIYAARKKLKTALVTDSWGGQSIVSSDIENWIGTPNISGNALATQLKAHVEKYAGDSLNIITGKKAVALSANDNSVTVTLADNKVLHAKTLIVASGAQRRKLTVKGAVEYDNKGLTYCATCDGPMYSGQDVVVIGGGNAAFETALQLLAYCKSVTLINRGDTFRADEITVTSVRNHPNMTIITNAELTEIVGNQFVSGIRYKDTNNGNEIEIPCSGIFVEIGMVPNTDWLVDTIKLSSNKQIIVDPRTQRTSHRRIWAAGDITDGLYHQNNIAAGDAIKALEDAYLFIKRGSDTSY